jgi:hypothetical protein
MNFCLQIFHLLPLTGDQFTSCCKLHMAHEITRKRSVLSFRQKHRFKNFISYLHIASVPLISARNYQTSRISKYNFQF